MSATFQPTGSHTCAPIGSSDGEGVAEVRAYQSATNWLTRRAEGAVHRGRYCRELLAPSSQDPDLPKLRTSLFLKVHGWT
jgi:hypothetical protein